MSTEISWTHSGRVGPAACGLAAPEHTAAARPVFVLAAPAPMGGCTAPSGGENQNGPRDYPDRRSTEYAPDGWHDDPEQTRQALANCEQVLVAGDGGLDDVVKVGGLLTHPDGFAAMNGVYAEYFRVDPPTGHVAKLGVSIPNVLVSVRMTASLAPPRSA